MNLKENKKGYVRDLEEGKKEETYVIILYSQKQKKQQRKNKPWIDGKY